MEVGDQFQALFKHFSRTFFHFSRTTKSHTNKHLSNILWLKFVFNQPVGLFCFYIIIIGMTLQKREITEKKFSQQTFTGMRLQKSEICFTQTRSTVPSVTRSPPFCSDLRRHEALHFLDAFFRSHVRVNEPLPWRRCWMFYHHSKNRQLHVGCLELFVPMPCTCYSSAIHLWKRTFP